MNYILYYGYLYTWTQNLTIVSISWRCIGYKRTGPWQDQAKAKLLCVQCGSQFLELRFQNVFFECRTTFDDFWPLHVPRSDLGIVFAWHAVRRHGYLWLYGHWENVRQLWLFLSSVNSAPLNILRFSIPSALWQFVWGIPWIPWLTLHAQASIAQATSGYWAFNGCMLRFGMSFTNPSCLGSVPMHLEQNWGEPFHTENHLLVFADICVCQLVWREAWSLYFLNRIKFLEISYCIAFQQARGCDGLPKLWPGSCKGWEMKCINMHFGTLCKVICRCLDSHCRSM